MRFSLTEFFPGFGTFAAPFTAGLRRHGEVATAAAAELDGRYLKHYSEQHPEASTFLGSLTSYAPQEISRANVGVRILAAGIPCTGSSKAGRSKLHLTAAEMHPHVGHLFLPVMHYVSAHLPDLCVFENVSEYQTTYSADCIRAHLASLGYLCREWVVNPYTDFETATERVRWVMVASRIGEFRWEYAARPFTGTIEHLLDNESDLDVEDAFSPAQVAAHTKFIERKKAEGAGFRRRILERTSTKVPTIPRTYGKIQPSSTFLKVGDSYRMFRPREVARIHGFGPDFIRKIEQLPKTTAYEVLGQGVVAKPFEALGDAIGQFAATQSCPALS